MHANLHHKLCRIQHCWCFYLFGLQLSDCKALYYSMLWYKALQPDDYAIRVGDPIAMLTGLFWDWHRLNYYNKNAYWSCMISEPVSLHNSLDYSLVLRPYPYLSLGIKLHFSITWEGHLQQSVYKHHNRQVFRQLAADNPAELIGNVG